MSFFHRFEICTYPTEHFRKKWLFSFSTFLELAEGSEWRTWKMVGLSGFLWGEVGRWGEPDQGVNVQQVTVSARPYVKSCKIRCVWRSCLSWKRRLRWILALTKPTRWRHILAYGSEDRRHVPRDVRHSCPLLFQPRQLKKSSKNIPHCITLFSYVYNCVDFSLPAENKLHDGIYQWTLMNLAWSRTWDN